MTLPVNQLICGDALTVLKTLPDESINCCISSPPYWALRDYDAPGQLGLESTFEEYIDKLCTIYDEVKRVLRKDGTCFVNLGDTYWGGKGQSGQGSPEYQAARQDVSLNKPASHTGGQKKIRPQDMQHATVQAKSLCLIPQRFAIEMVNRGWILRNVIIWAKPNPMPSSAKDRFTVDYELVFFFVKSSTATFWLHPRKMRTVQKKPPPDYIWIHKKTGLEVDYQPFSDRLCKGKKRLWDRGNLWSGQDYFFEPQYEAYLTESNAERPRMGQGQNTKYKQKRTYGGGGSSFLGHSGTLKANGNQIQHNPLGRNKRCVWTIPTQAFPEAHFATYPEKLVEPMILAGCPEFVCKKCGQARKRVYNIPYDKDHPTYNKWLKTQPLNTKYKGKQPTINGKGGVGYGSELSRYYTEIWGSKSSAATFKGYTDCGCRAGFRPGIVLDPFVGSGTTAQVAAYLRRDWIGIDLKYIEMAKRRIAQGETGIPVKEQRQGQLALFP